MAGLPDAVLFAVTRIQVDHVAGNGFKRTISGTGFWLRVGDGRAALVTNKHVVNSRLKYPDELGLEPDVIRVLLRKPGLARETKWCDVQARVWEHASADVAVFLDFNAFDPEGYTAPVGVELWQLANSRAFEEQILLTDAATFVGYPASDHTLPWWDTEWELPIARSCTVASWPRKPYHNPGVVTSDTMLVSGLSFGGSSGSPCILDAKLAPPGVGVPGGQVPSMVIGVMSGGWRDSADESKVFRHTGLSYITRSTAIIDVLVSAGVMPMPGTCITGSAP